MPFEVFDELWASYGLNSDPPLRVLLGSPACVCRWCGCFILTELTRMRPSSLTPIVSTVALLSAVPSLSALGQQADGNDVSNEAVSAAPVSLEARALTRGVTINLDGRIDESAWAMATPITDFTQQEPVEGAEPSERTEIRVVFDDDNLYIGAILYDDPEGVMAYQRERDAFLNTDDRFMWILDTFLDGRTGYSFEINAAGLMGDGIISGGGGRFGGSTSRAWDGIWEVRTATRPDGWSAEIQIPFRTLNFDPNQSEWGINFQRTIRRKNEEILWRGYRRSEGLRDPVYAGRLTGLQNMSQGVGLEVRPSAITNWRNVPAGPVRNTYPADVSLDVNYSVISSLRASVSVNTDFAELESDQRRVNLTRFPLRFPERRDFFLEGSGVFSFAPRSGPSPFYSRNIGIRDGQQIPIRYGTRLTGQVDAFELGFYQLGTGTHTYLDTDNVAATIRSEDFTVARVKRSFLEQSAIGVIYTRRDGLLDSGAQHTAGVDLDFSTRYFLGDKNLEVEAFVAWNSNPDPIVPPNLELGDLTSRGARLSFPNDIWTGHVSYREFGDSYDPSLGFVTRNDYRRLENRMGWSPRTPGISWLRQLDFSGQVRLRDQMSTGIVEEREFRIEPLGLNFESGDNIGITVTHTNEYLDFQFEPSDGITVEQGRYRNWEYQINVRSSGRRRVSLYGGLTRGGFWDGDRQRAIAFISFRPRPGITILTNVRHNDVSMPTGDFTTAAYELGAEWHPSPWVSFTNQLQYDDQSELLGLFSRVRWIVKPGNDVFFVYTHNWQYEHLDPLDANTRELQRLSRGASIKVNYTYRF